MAKKKKKKHLIKINNKIRALLGKPFDEAVESFSDRLLFDLAVITEFENKEKSPPKREEIIRFLRRLWSEGKYLIRKRIFEFIKDAFEQEKVKKRDKAELILSLLEDIETTPQEDEKIIMEFLDKSSSKITKEKILSKLFYIRMNRFFDKLSEALNVTFIGHNYFEFIHPYTLTFNIDKVDINLIHRADIEMGVDRFIELSFEEAKEHLIKLKERAIEKRKGEVKEFNQNILTLPYFEDDSLVDIFKNLNEPVEELYRTPIPLNYVKDIFHKIDPTLEITLNKSNFKFSKLFSAKIFGEDIEYYITIKYDKGVVYSSIWNNEINLIYSDLFEANRKELQTLKSLLDTLKESMAEMTNSLNLTDKEIESYILKYIKPTIDNSKSINLKSKIIRKSLYLFSEEIKPLKERQKREELLAKTIRDFKLLFPVARSLNREIIFHMGPTNSGKTYSALNELEKATTGVYLAPLRLLALEGYENLKARGVNVSLITGEEEIIDEESTHISSTIEMLNSDIEIDVCVIDEIQMINDRDRGWAWANALIGAPAKRVILTGSSNALEVVKEIANYLNEPLKVVEFERKNPLILMDKSTSIDKLEPATAIVTFSRKEVLALKERISSKYDISVIYGNLSPEVRREEARRFREGESDILIATDAISMGLNLPIKTILFAKDNKFDGVQRRELTTSEILQISGRAGRYGLYESGYVGALDRSTLSTIKRKFNRPLPPIELPVTVMASLEHVLLISEILETENLSQILEFFSKNMEFEGPFVASNIESMQEIAKIVDEYKLDLVSKYHLSCAPITLNSPYLEKVFHNILSLLESGKSVPFKPIERLPKKALSYTSLLNAEDRVKEVSLYLWLSFKFNDKFLDVEVAKEARYKLNQYIERSLKESNFVKYCRKCGKELDLSSKFIVCDECYNRRYRNKRSRKYGI